MDLFKAQFDRIARQLGGLTPSQKMLTATLVAIMIMTLVWWGRYAAEPEYESLLSGTGTPEEMVKAHDILKEHGISSTLSGDNLSVPADQKLQAYSVLAYSKALPHGSKDVFDDILKSVNPLQSQSVTDKMWTHGRELLAAQMIRSFPGVASASVTISAEQEFHFGTSIDPTAGVSIQTEGGRGENVSQQLVNAAADVLESSLAGMKRPNIRVIVDGMPRKIENIEAGVLTPGEQETAAQAAEHRLEEKITHILSYIHNPIVTVTVQVNPTRLDEHKMEFDPKNTVSKERETRTTSTETSTPVPPAGEAGAQPNTGFNAGVPAAAGVAGTSTKEENESKFDNFVGHKESETHTPAGTITPTTAAVRIPLSYFAMLYKEQNPNAKDANEATMKDVIDKEKLRVKADIAAAIGLGPESDKIFVEPYLEAPTSIAAVPVATATTSLRMLTPRHIKEGLLGVMALASLFMVSSLVKKGVPGPLPEQAPAQLPTLLTNILQSGEQIAGEVAAVDPSLDAMELDDEAIRAQQMVEQVATLVKENPESAASLVKRWLNRP